MLKIKQNNKVRLYEQVLTQINGFIECGAWKPGCKIPSEKELKEQLGVGTAVLRETFRILESKNIIESRQGQGRFLRNIRPELILDNEIPQSVLNKSSLLDVLDIRINLEIAAVEALITKGTDEQIAEIEKSLKCQNRTHEMNPAETFEAQVAKATGNFILTSMIIQLQTMSRSLEQKNYLGFERWKVLNDEHEVILNAIKKRDLIAGRAAVYKHIHGIKDILMEKDS